MMKTNKETLKAAMDRRLSFLDDVPSCRAAVQARIAQEEEPVMKKKVSFGFVFALVLVLLSVAALATGLLLSPRVSATQLADRAMEKTYGINAEMQTFFGREEEELPDGTVQVNYTGAGSLAWVLGTYTATVKDGKATVSWSHDDEDVSGGYESEAWGLEQLKQMLMDCLDEKLKDAYLEKAAAIAEKHNVLEDDEPSEAIEGLHEQIEAAKTDAMEARKLSEQEMIDIGRAFIISYYGLNEEQAGRMQLYTSTEEDAGNGWYDMMNGQPCYEVEYLLYQQTEDEEGLDFDPRDREEKDGYYIVYVNVETGAVEQYEYNSGLGGKG